MENRIGYVYKITSPNGRVYIGSTLSVIKRKSAYKTLHCKSQRRLYSSLVKYGWDSHLFEVILECSAAVMKNKETEYGALYNCLGKDGLNCNLPKTDEKIPFYAEETRKLMSESSKRRGFSELAKRNCQLAKYGSNRNVGNKNRSKLVLNLETGIYFDSAKSAAETYNIHPCTIHNMLNTNHFHTNKTSLIYV